MALSRETYNYRDGRVGIAIDSSPEYGSPAIWPSVGEYPIYDPYLYYAMSNDTVRNDAFRAALLPACPGRRVLDIGTGENVHWALEAARQGAQSVVALEAMPRSHAVATKRLAQAPEREKVDLRYGVSFDHDLDPRADVCVAELIGSFASSEGMLAAMADAHARLLNPGAVVVPAACDTLVAPVSLRDLFPAGLAFSSDALPYLRQIFDFNGGPFDLRLTVVNPDPGCVLSSGGVVEQLRFDRAEPLDATTEVELRIERAGRVDGLLCWIRLDAGPGADTTIDSLLDKTNWTPAYLPLFDESLDVCEGDVVTVSFERRTSPDGVHPDYLVDATLTRSLGVVSGSFVSCYRGRSFGTAAVYRELFSS
ncbi:protein arginine N-methyltransferase 1 [Micromonospora echinofusca]|uniref:Protein arginine N-methyltransferase 1 n=1 Tax=Micromonospora echinofusca TaxID=47858 RepID=A0A1C5GGA9_MICEH|nr:hypothetical protein [Micromonospora echinofusca]SCG18830.1 protein arginine N-methyltransferase 1 [Micromonospora echinofusca]